MQCLAPWNIPNPKFNNSKIRLTVPCGKCAGCLTTRRTEWTSRLKFELEDSTTSHFITLTYSDENITYGQTAPTLVKSDLQNFLKRLRRSIQPKKIRYYAVGEYGTITYRPHYHLIMFNLPNDKIQNIPDTWQQGHTQIGTVTGASIHYVTKYHLNRNIYPEGSEPSFCTMSRKPGIGFGYINKYKSYHDGKINRNFILHRGGVKSKLPRYYKDKLYTEAEREQIAVIGEELNNSFITDEIIEEHNRKNPDISYFEYLEQQKLNYEENYKIKINKNNVL